MALTPEKINDLAHDCAHLTDEEFARAVEAEARRDALEEAAKEFDRRAKPMSGWYEPDEPAKIIRKLKEDIQ